MTGMEAGRTRRHAAAGLRAGLLAAVLLGWSVDALPARQARLWTPESRTVVTQGGEISALAVARMEVYAATRDAVLVYDPFREEWRPPILLPGPRVATITAIGFDPASGEIWIGTGDGEVVRGLPGFRAWERIAAPVRGGIDAIVPDPADAAVWILARGEWWRVDASSSFADPVGVSQVPAHVREEALRGPDDPYLAAARSSLGLDPQTRRWPITDVARGIEPGEFWIATGGGGLVRFETRGAGREWLRFGLVSAGAATVAHAGDRLWFGGDGRGRQNGVAAATPDLTEWWQYDAAQGAPGGFVAEIAFDGPRVWFAAEDGLFRFDAREGNGRRAWTRWTSADGLPSDRVRSVLHEEGRIWAGTDRGVVAFDTAGRRIVGPLLAGRRVARVARSTGGLWLAGDDGLRELPLGDASAEPVVPPGLPAILANGRVLDVATAAGTWVLSDAGLFRIDAGGVQGPLRDAALGRIGPPIRLATDGARLWVAGARGIAQRDPTTGAWETLTVPADIPSGPVLDVFPSGDDVWAGTPAGAVRLRWR